MTYSEKLKDPRWQKKRLEVMNRDKWKCLCCDDDSETLMVHHLVYTGEPWDAPLEHLETLCETCHDNRELLNKLVGRSLIPTRVTDQFIQFCRSFEKGSQTHSLNFYGAAFFWWYFHNLEPKSETTNDQRFEDFKLQIQRLIEHATKVFNQNIVYHCPLLPYTRSPLETPSRYHR